MEEDDGGEGMDEEGKRMKRGLEVHGVNRVKSFGRDCSRSLVKSHIVGSLFLGRLSRS